MKGRNSQIARIYKILSLIELNQHGLSVADLTSRLNDRGFEVGKRTVYRDLEALKAAGFPLDTSGKSEDNAIRWRLDLKTNLTHQLVFNIKELYSLYLIKGVVSTLDGLPFINDIKSFFSKIEEKLASRSLEFLEELDNNLEFSSKEKSVLHQANESIWETISNACSEKHCLIIDYKSASSGKTGERKVGPEFVLFSKGSSYLIAKDLEANIVKTFALPRISNAIMTDEPYETEGVDPSYYYANSFGIYKGGSLHRVSLLFSASTSQYIAERKWHDSQTIEDHHDGSCTLTLELEITPEFVSWILSFGSDVRILSPQPLIDEITERTKSVLCLYESTPNLRKHS